MASNRFESGNVVRVHWSEGGAQFWYTARVIGAAQRAGDFEVEVIDPGTESGVKAGSRLAPILTDADVVKMDLVSRG
jgi:hypothetical protein